jgi:hypothetical protein
MKVYPDKKVLLYGEEDFSSDSLKKFDLIFMPSFEISKLKENSVELFINKNSLGEMTKEAATNYISYITRSTNYFFHMNHEMHHNIYANNERALLAHEYPIPMEEFNLLWRQPDLGHMQQKDKVGSVTDIYVYLYKKSNVGPLPA